MPLIRLKTKGQITIPASVRKEVGMDIGSLVEATVEGKSVVLRVRRLAESNPDEPELVAKRLGYTNKEELIKALREGAILNAESDRQQVREWSPVTEEAWTKHHED